MFRRKALLFGISNLIGFFSFFMPWIQDLSYNLSGYAIIQMGLRFNWGFSWLLGLLPFAFLLSAVLKFIPSNFLNKTIKKSIDAIPILLILTIAICLFISADNFSIPSNFFDHFLRSVRLGLYLTIATSVICLFSPASIFN